MFSTKKATGISSANARRFVITIAQSMQNIEAFWNESEGGLRKIDRKYATGIRYFASEGTEEK
jgi:hypothetical protein